MTPLPGHRPPAASTLIAAARRAGSALDGEPALARSYDLCRRLHAVHGRTYYFATRFLPPSSRPHVHALYALARYADDLVDRADPGWDAERRRKELERWSDDLLTALADPCWRPPAGDPGAAVLPAVAHTVRRLNIALEDVRAFLASMAMDLTVMRYRTYADLYAYMYGSAAVIGTMMLPVLEPLSPAARGYAMDLGVAFQLTNFLRDISEDYDRDRIYLPLEDLDRFGVTEDDFRARHVGPAFRRLLAFEIARARALYRRAERGCELLPPSSGLAIRIALRAYREILDRIERYDHQVFATRAAVPTARKLVVAVAELTRQARVRSSEPPIYSV